MEVFNTEMALAQAGSVVGSQGDIQPSADSLSDARKAAQDFEAMMIEEMLKSMRKANDVLAEDSLLGSREQGFWQDFQDSKLAMEMASGRGLGLTEQLLQQIEKFQG